MCPLYETPGQRMGALVPYFRAGLARGEQCLYIADDANVDDLRALCQYDVRRFQASVLRDVLRTHPLAILGERMHDNLYFEPPALVLGGAEVDDQRVAWMRAQLEARTRRQMALADLG